METTFSGVGVAGPKLADVTTWGSLFLVASQALRIVAGETAAWQAFARWFIS